MSAILKRRMTLDDFLAWAEEQGGLYELFDGVPYALSHETIGHTAMKHRVARALEDGIRARGLDCHMLPDGAIVRIDPTTAYVPDALVYCGPALPDLALEVPNPAIVVDVLSHAPRHSNTGLKLAGYFQIPSMQHYLIVNPGTSSIILHSRRSDVTLQTYLLSSGTIHLDPPGLEIDTAALFPR